MIEDLDRSMLGAGLEAVIVPMHEHSDPSFRWLSRGARITRGFALHVVGRTTTLVYDPMERDEAVESGLDVMSMHDLGRDEIFRTALSVSEAWSGLYDKALRDAGVSGSVAFFGRVPLHVYDGVLHALRAKGWTIPTGRVDDLILQARKRKSGGEIEKIEEVGRRTERIVDEVRGTLRRAEIRGSEVWLDGDRLTIGYLKSLVSSEIARLGLVEDHETILSMGRDAGVPHSRGDATAVLRPSVPIVLDIFPMDRVSGYFFDFTRTFCVGDVPVRLGEIHRDVATAFDIAVAELRAGVEAAGLHDLVCDYFEGRGYPTGRSAPGMEHGYVHGLGHGVGLEVHERPSFSRGAGARDLVEAGDVLTIEPGLYFPEECIGVRIEETFVIEEDGRPRSLCRSDRSLVP